MSDQQTSFREQASDIIDQVFVDGIIFMADRSKEESDEAKADKQIAKDQIVALHEQEIIEVKKRVVGLIRHEERTGYDTYLIRAGLLEKKLKEQAH